MWLHVRKKFAFLLFLHNIFIFNIAYKNLSLLTPIDIAMGEQNQNFTAIIRSATRWRKAIVKFIEMQWKNNFTREILRLT